MMLASTSFENEGGRMKNDSRGGLKSTLVLVSLLVLWSFGCGTEGGVPGTLLDGDPDSPAIDAAKDFDSGDRITGAEISEASNGTKVVRTKVEIEFSTDATVGEVNALLESHEALITSMLEGLNFIVVRVPDPGSLEALDALVAVLESDSSVVGVYQAFVPVKNELPDNYDADGSPLPRIDHHLAVRAHAAWNAKAALRGEFSAPPLLIMQDFFGGGAPNSDFNVKSAAGLYGTGKPDEHGYHVLGILAAKHGGTASDRGQATGIYPGTLQVLPFDLTWMDQPTIENQILFQAETSNQNIVVNSSVGHDPVCTESVLDCLTPLAQKWIKKVRGLALYETGKTGPASLENKFLMLSAAGNVEPSRPSDPALDSWYNAARLLTELDTEMGVRLDNLNNTLVIEDRENSSSQPYKADCLSDGSMHPGDLSAIGTDVWSLTGASAGADNFSGTSMATPQVAGLAAYVWTLAPGLTPQELLSLLSNTARSDACPSGGTSARPVIDAYSAVLAVDHDSALSGGGTPEAPVRLAILDLVDDKGDPGGNGAFDEKDLERFLQEYSGAEGEIDYSRYDLNGDGWTDGRCDRTEKFNLDIDYPPSYGSVTQDMQGKAVSFDEAKATDMHVLCYYAYSPLYTGDLSLRDSALGSRCGECDGDDPPTPWTAPPEFLRRQDSAGGLVELGTSLGSLYSKKNCFTSQSSAESANSYVSTGCITDTLNEVTRTDIEPQYVGPLSASWSFAYTTDLIESSASISSSSETSVDVSDTDLVIAGSLAASATASSTEDQGLQAVGDGSAGHSVSFKVPAVLYELTWDCNLTHVELNRGLTLIVFDSGRAPTWKVESCEGASGSLPSGEYSFSVNARAQSYSAGGSDPNPQARGGSFRLVLRPPPP